MWSPLTRSHGGGSKGVTDAAEHAEGSGGHMSQASEYPRVKGVVGEGVGQVGGPVSSQARTH